MQRRTELWFIGIFIAVILVAVVVAAFVSTSVSPGAASFNATVTAALTSADHARGNTTNPKLTLIEYGDFECPACDQYEPIMEQLTSEYGDRVEFIFRNFPLYQIHPFAMIGAQAAEAAALQGKYWEMHDLLYTKQGEWTANTSIAPADVVTKYFNGYATSLGLDVAKFDTDINSSAVKARVQKDLDSGNAAQVDHTPTFFINLTQIANPSSAADFKSVLDAALASTTAAQ